MRVRVGNQFPQLAHGAEAEAPLKPLAPDLPLCRVSGCFESVSKNLVLKPESQGRRTEESPKRIKGGWVILLSRSDDVCAVGATYKADAGPRSLAVHRSLYLSLLGDELAAGETRRTQMRMIRSSV